MPEFTLPNGERINTTTTEFGTRLRDYFSDHGDPVIDAARGNPGGFSASASGLTAGIEHLEDRQKTGAGYGYSSGNYPERPALSTNLNTLFGTDNFFDKDGLFFSTGEIEALNAVSKSLAGGDVITPYPHYVNYPIVFSGKDGKARLLPVKPQNDETLVAALKKKLGHSHNVSAILICDPNNPTGTKLSAQEWRELFKLVETESARRPGFKLVIDFAYYGLSNDWMETNGTKKLAVEPLKILEAEFPELKKNIVPLFSLTKVGGLFDERPCVSYTADKDFRDKLEQHRTEGTFEPVATSVAICSGVVDELANTDRLAKMSDYYGARARMIEKTLSELGVLTHQWQGGLYVTADLSGLYGTALSPKARQWVGHEKIESDFDIMASLAYPNDPDSSGVLASIVDPKDGGKTGLIRFSACLESMDDVRKLQHTLGALKPELNKSQHNKLWPAKDLLPLEHYDGHGRR